MNISNLEHLKVGDEVFPAYDGKICRATRCKVAKIKNGKIYVQGHFWGLEETAPRECIFDLDGEGWLSSDSELMPLLGITNDDGDRAGDFYQLLTKEFFDNDDLVEYLPE